MFESHLLAVTLVALGLLVPSSVLAMVLARGRHASASIGGDRRARVAVAAAFAATAGGSAGWLLGSGPAASVAAALALAVPVLVWAFLAPWWPVRAVVAWAMLVTGSVGSVALGTARALESPAPWSAPLVAAAGSAVVVLALGHLNGPFRRMLGIRAGIRRAVRTPLFLRPALLRPALALAVFFAALVAGGLTGVAPLPGEASTPEAGFGPDPGRGLTSGPTALGDSDVRRVSAETTRPAEATGDELSPAAGGALAALAGSDSGATGTGAWGGASAGATGTSGGPVGGTGPGTGTGTGTGGAWAGSTSSGATRSSGAGITEGTTGSGSPAPTGGGGQGGTQDDPVQQVADTVADVVDTVEQTADPVTGGGAGGGGADGGGDGGGGGGGGVLEPVQSTVEETVEPVQAVVEETVVEPVQAVVEETVEPVQTAVEDTLEQVTDPVRPGRR